MRPQSVFKCPDFFPEFFLRSGKWDVKHIPVSFLPFGISAARENSGLACHLQNCPNWSVFFTEPRNVHKPQSRLILGCFLRMTPGICSGEEPKGPLATHRRGSRGLLDKGDIWKVSINRFSKHHFFPPSQTQNFAWYFRKFVLSSANTRVSWTVGLFHKFLLLKAQRRHNIWS